MREFRQDRILHLGRDQLQHVIEKRAFARGARVRGLEEEIRDFPQQFAALRAVGGAREIDQLREPGL
jgi:hypothetical protein